MRDRTGVKWEAVGAITAIAMAALAAVYAYAANASGANAEIAELKAASARHELRFQKLEQNTDRLSELLTGLRVDMAGLSHDIRGLRDQLAAVRGFQP